MIAATLREFYPQICDTRVVTLAVDCFPWHGSLELSILTVEEVDADPELIDPAAIASWRYYDFAESLSAWTPTKALGSQMSAAYYDKAHDDCATIADAFFCATAAAAKEPDVAAAIELLKRDRRFRVSVSHPDDGREFYQG